MPIGGASVMPARAGDVDRADPVGAGDDAPGVARGDHGAEGHEPAERRVDPGLDRARPPGRVDGEPALNAHAASARGCEQLLAARRGEGHGPGEFQRRRHRDQLFGREARLAAEGATDIARDHPDPLGLQTEQGRDVGAGPVRRLGGVMDQKPIAVRGHADRSRLQRRRRDEAVPGLDRDDRGRVREGAVGIAGPPGDGEGLGGRRLILSDLEDDRIERIARRRHVARDHGGNGLSDGVEALRGKRCEARQRQGFDGAVDRRGRDRRRVVRREHGDDAGHGTRGGDVEAGDLGGSDGAAQEGDREIAGRAGIVGEQRAAREQALVLAPRQPPSDLRGP